MPTPHKKCECGCGQITKISTRTRASIGQVKGEPRQFVAGHHMRKRERYCVDSNGCWVWLLSKNKQGYGKLSIKDQPVRAHRYYYEQYKGEIPTGLVVDHICRNTSCVNPDHLEAVTYKENVLRGDSPPSKNAKKTHCKWGHAFVAENLVKGVGSRKCLACLNRRSRQYSRIKRKKERAKL